MDFDVFLERVRLGAEATQIEAALDALLGDQSLSARQEAVLKRIRGELFETWADVNAQPIGKEERDEVLWRNMRQWHREMIEMAIDEEVAVDNMVRMIAMWRWLDSKLD